MYYRAEKAGNLLTCRNYDQTLITTISNTLVVASVQGASYRILNVQASDLVDMKFAYEFWLSSKIAYTDIVSVQTSIEASWKLFYSVDVSVTVSYQQEYVTDLG